jgi:predicted P-loop ATPase
VIDTQQFAAVPARLREARQWLIWRFESHAGEKKPRKVPYYADGKRRSGQQGSEADRARLVDMVAALAAAAAKQASGIGFAFLPGDGLIGIDIDGAIDAETGEIAPRAQAIITACASYTEYSPSRRGVHIIVAGESETFKSNDIGLEVFCGRQYFTFTGAAYAGTPAEVAAIDAATLRRLRATVDQAKGRRQEAAQPDLPPVSAEQKMRSALAFLSPECGYEEWIEVGMAIHAELGEGAFGVWDAWSAQVGSKYPGRRALEGHWKSFAPGRGITGATVFKRAMEAGWRPPKPVKAPDTLPEAGAGKGKPKGKPAVKRPDWWAHLIKRPRGGIEDCRENVFLVLHHHPDWVGVLGFDEFAFRVVKRKATPWGSPPGEWTPADDYELGLWLARELDIVIKAEAHLVAGVAMEANRQRFHPVREFIAAQHWDAVPRLDFWLVECLGVPDTAYARLAGRYFIMGMVNRVLSPGCPMHYMLILEGRQGKGKSSALRVLADPWFADTPFKLGDKDAMLNLSGAWLYEIAEMDSFNRAETTAVKSFVTGQTDRVREPYSRRFVDKLRQSVLAGTTNQHEYFKDNTGNRRFWPVAVGALNLDRLRDWRGQLFAEAAALLAAGHKYHPTRQEELLYFMPEQESREIGDPWLDLIAGWLNLNNVWPRLTASGQREELTAAMIMREALHVPSDRIDNTRQMAIRVGLCMRKLGWRRVRSSHLSGGHRAWVYEPPQPRADATQDDEEREDELLPL